VPSEILRHDHSAATSYKSGVKIYAPHQWRVGIHR
jgi:hypothetical protein